MTETNAKERLLKAAMELMNETEDMESITVRKIAQRAGVGLGLVNYHFQSREKLLYEAVGTVMVQVLEAFRQKADPEMPPEERLKAMLFAVCELGFKYEKEVKIGAQYQLYSGDFMACNYFLPQLREIFKGRRDETALRIIAFQIFSITNLILLREDAFFSFTGVDLHNDQQRKAMINTLVDIYL